MQSAPPQHIILLGGEGACMGETHENRFLHYFLIQLKKKRFFRLDWILLGFIVYSNSFGKCYATGQRNMVKMQQKMHCVPIQASHGDPLGWGPAERLRNLGWLGKRCWLPTLPLLGVPFGTWPCFYRTKCRKQIFLKVFFPVFFLLF